MPKTNNEVKATIKDSRFLVDLSNHINKEKLSEEIKQAASEFRESINKFRNKTDDQA